MEKELKLTTGVKDLDYEIFLRLSDDDILNICSLNKEMSKLCDDEEFWKRRVKFYYHINKKPKRLSWNGFYAYLKQYPLIITDHNIKIETPEKELIVDRSLFGPTNREIRKGDIVIINIKKALYHYFATKIIGSDKIKLEKIIYTTINQKDAIIFPKSADINSIITYYPYFYEIFFKDDPKLKDITVVIYHTYIILNLVRLEHTVKREDVERKLFIFK